MCDGGDGLRTTLALNSVGLVGLVGIGKPVADQASGLLSSEGRTARQFAADRPKRKKADPTRLYHLSHGQREPDGFFSACPAGQVAGGNANGRPMMGFCRCTALPAAQDMTEQELTKNAAGRRGAGSGRSRSRPPPRTRADLLKMAAGRGLGISSTPAAALPKITGGRLTGPRRPRKMRSGGLPGKLCRARAPLPAVEVRGVPAPPLAAGLSSPLRLSTGGRRVLTGTDRRGRHPVAVSFPADTCLPAQGDSLWPPTSA
jgi:hypothetical protein